jgi:hypothetical protein
MEHEMNGYYRPNYFEAAFVSAKTCIEMQKDVADWYLG